MTLKFLKKPNFVRGVLAVNRKKLEFFLIPLIVVGMVGGTFFYLFQTRDLDKTVLGGLISNLLIDRTEQENESDQELFALEDDGEYKEVALQGDGLTHIARRVTARYIEENGITDLTVEHKIYIEDYIQKKLGSGLLSLGEEISISQDLVSEAVNSSRELTDQQLNNLQQYSSLVSYL